MKAKKAKEKTRDLLQIAFQGTNPNLRPAPSQLPQPPVLRNFAQDNITGFWAATGDMDMETELGERIRTKKFKKFLSRYMDTDDQAVADGEDIRRTREDVHRIQVGLHSYEAYQKALPPDKVSWICGQCGITERDNYRSPTYKPLEQLGCCRVNIHKGIKIPI